MLHAQRPAGAFLVNVFLALNSRGVLVESQLPTRPWMLARAGKGRAKDVEAGVTTASNKLGAGGATSGSGFPHSGNDCSSCKLCKPIASYQGMCKESSTAMISPIMKVHYF